MPTVDLRCSFCGKKQEEARRLVFGPGVAICGECLAVCVEIIDSEMVPSASAETRAPHLSTSPIGNIVKRRWPRRR